MNIDAEILKQKIEELKRQNATSKAFVYDGKQLELFRCPISSKQTSSDSQFYLVDKNQLLGEGTSGQVYTAYAITADLQLANTPFIAKMFAPPKAKTKKSKDKEFEIQRRYQPTAQIKEQFRIILFTKNLGKEILSDGDVPNPKLKSLSFRERLDLICQLALNINLLHHNTPRTGSAVIHCDIKGSNLLVDIHENRIDAAICDYGTSIEVFDDPSLLTELTEPAGSPGYLPPEAYAEIPSRGLKSDIYALLPVILVILGAKDPFTRRQTANQEFQNFLENKDNSYDFAGIFTGLSLPNYFNNIKDIVINFLNRMHQNDYNLRPDSDELVTFFITLRHYCLCCEKNNDEQLKNILLTKLIILASGNWQHQIGTRNVEHFTEGPKDFVKTDKKISLPKTFAHYDFSEHPAITNTAIELHKKGLLTSCLQKLLFEKNNVQAAQAVFKLCKANIHNSNLIEDFLKNFTIKQAKAIHSLYANHLLDSSSLSLVTTNLEFVKNLNQLSSNDLSVLVQLHKASKKHVNLSYAEFLSKAVTNTGISEMAVLKTCLRTYQTKRANHKQDYFHFWSKLTGFNCKTKSDAINELIDYVDGKQNSITGLSQKALNDGTVSKIIKDFKSFRAIPNLSEVLREKSLLSLIFN